MLLAQLEIPASIPIELPTETPILLPIETSISLLSLPVQGQLANIVCDFYTPKDYAGQVPTTKQDVWSYASSSCFYNFASTTNVSSTAGFTYGESLTNFLLFLIIVAMITGFIFKNTIRRK